MIVMKERLKFIYAVFFIFILAKANAQPFAADIAAFGRQDSIRFPGTGKIVFAGSSSFTNWTDVQTYFPSYPIINRGFGGSTLQDVYRYRNEVIYKYKPKQVVIYCGENDIAGDSTVTGKTVFKRFKQLYKDLRKNLGSIPVVYVSMKPSPSRWHLREKYIDGNKRIQQFLAKNEKDKFVSVWDAMLGTDGKPIPEIFVADNLHMNAKGYAIWQQIISPLLIL